MRSLRQQPVRPPLVSNTTFITWTQSKMTTTNEQPFFRHCERVITERHATFDVRQTGATNIVTE